MKLSLRQIELVRSTFALMESKSRVVPLAFYQRLFTLNPSLRPQRRFDIDAESDRFMALLKTAADFADRPQLLRAMLGEREKSGASFGPVGEQHSIAGEALLWALATTLGREFTPEARVAWSELHNAMAQMMHRETAGPPLLQQRLENSSFKPTS